MVSDMKIELTKDEIKTLSKAFDIVDDIATRLEIVGLNNFILAHEEGSSYKCKVEVVYDAQKSLGRLIMI